MADNILNIKIKRDDNTSEYEIHLSVDHGGVTKDTGELLQVSDTLKYELRLELDISKEDRKNIKFIDINIDEMGYVPKFYIDLTDTTSREQWERRLIDYEYTKYKGYKEIKEEISLNIEGGPSEKPTYTLLTQEVLFSDAMGQTVVKVGIIENQNKRTTLVNNVDVIANNSNKITAAISMLEYLYSNKSQVILNRDQNETILTNKSIERDFPELDSLIKRAKKIITMYENNQFYFIHQAQTKAKEVMEIGAAEKVKEITPEIIKYLMQNPDSFQKVGDRENSKGIQEGGPIKDAYYRVDKSLIQMKRQDKYIYENKAIVQFLQHLKNWFQVIYDAIIKMEENQQDPITSHKDEGAHTFDKISMLSLSKSQEQVALQNVEECDLKNVFGQTIERIEDLQNQYSNILGIYDRKGFDRLRGTGIFINNSMYNQFFRTINEWLDQESTFIVEDLKPQDELESYPFASLWKLYEGYVLERVLQELMNGESGAWKASRFEYLPKFNRNAMAINNTYFEDAIINNTFTYKNEEREITVYYQPVIPRLISLTLDYLNSKVNTFHKDWNDLQLIKLEESKSYLNNAYFTPDYIIKIKSKDNINYHVIDAKYSTAENIVKAQLKKLRENYTQNIMCYELDENIKPGVSIHNPSLSVICGKGVRNDNRSIKEKDKEYIKLELSELIKDIKSSQIGHINMCQCIPSRQTP